MLFIYHILRGLHCKSLQRMRCKGCCSEKVNNISKSTVGKEEEEMKKRYISYQGKLTLIFAVMSVSVIIAFASVQLAMEQKNLTQTLYRTVQTENQKNAVALSNVLESVKDLSDALVLNENLYDQLEKLARIAEGTDMNSLEGQQKLFAAMLISKLSTMQRQQNMRLYSINGMCVSVNKEYSRIEDKNYETQDWYPGLEAQDRDWMWTLREEGDQTLLTFCRTVKEITTGKLVGYLEVNMDFTEDTKEILEEASLKEGYCYYLLQGEKLKVTNDVALKGEPMEKGLFLSAEEALVSRMQKTEEIVRTGLAGREYLLSSSPILGTEFVLVSGVDYAILQKQTRQGLWLVLGIMVLGVATAITISSHLARGMTRNIHKLNKAMQEAQKDPQIQVEITSHDEIAMLGDSFNRMIRRLEQTYKSLYETELTLKEAQNMALQAQINPHFLYNTLETIDALSVCERMEDIGTVVQALSKVFRYALGEETSVTLREELGHVNDYLKILGIRYENKFTWETDVEEELLSLQLPKIIFQPLAENAIIHGILKKRGTSEIFIRARRQEEEICLEVEDTGLGMNEETLEKLKSSVKSGIESKEGKVREPAVERENANQHESNGLSKETKKARKHIGIENVDRRMGYYFGEAYFMTIESIPMQGTKISMHILQTKPAAGQENMPDKDRKVLL